MYSNRRLYLGLKESLSSFFSEPTRFLKQSLTVESAFEKPYQESEYTKMHLNIPTPDWGPGRKKVQIEKSRYRGINPELGDTTLYAGCGFAYHDPWPDCATRPLEIIPMIMSLPPSDEPYILDVKALEGKILSYGAGKENTHSLLGEYLEVWLDPTIETHVLEITVSKGSKKKHTYKVVCLSHNTSTCEQCDCEFPDDPFEFDNDSTADTIASGGGVTVYVTGGCGPFTWAVAGTGYSWTGGSSTEARNNTLISAAGT